MSKRFTKGQRVLVNLTEKGLFGAFHLPAEPVGATYLWFDEDDTDLFTHRVKLDEPLTSQTPNIQPLAEIWVSDSEITPAAAPTTPETEQ